MNEERLRINAETDVLLDSLREIMGKPGRFTKVETPYHVEARAALALRDQQRDWARRHRRTGPVVASEVTPLRREVQGYP